MKKILIPLSVSLLLVALIAYFLASDSGEQYEEYDGVESARQAAGQGGSAAAATRGCGQGAWQQRVAAITGRGRANS